MKADDLMTEALQIALSLPGEDALQLMGRAREHQDVDAAGLKGTAGSRPGGVGQDRAVFRQPRLPEVVLRHGDVHRGLKKAADVGLDLRVVDQLPSKALRHHLLCEVVIGGAQAAGGEEDVRPSPGGFQHGAQPLRIVPYHRVVADADAQGVQLPGEVLGVGVGDAAQQQLRPHSDDFRGIHNASFHGEHCAPEPGEILSPLRQVLYEADHAVVVPGPVGVMGSGCRG